MAAVIDPRALGTGVPTAVGHIQCVQPRQKIRISKPHETDDDMLLRHLTRKRNEFQGLLEWRNGWREKNERIRAQSNVHGLVDYDFDRSSLRNDDENGDDDCSLDNDEI
jgi:hypothetical protein